MSKRYFVGRAPDLTKLITYQPINSILDWYVFSLDSEDLNGINSLSDRFAEMDKEMAIFGMRSIGDVRSVIKVPADELKTEADLIIYLMLIWHLLEQKQQFLSHKKDMILF